MEKVNIMLVDDHQLVRDGIKSLLEDEESFVVSSEASNGDEAISILEQNQPDVMIIDIRMPKMTGIELVSKLGDRSIHTRFLMLSMHDSEEYVISSLQAGAHGYLLKDASKAEFIKAINTVHSGELYFSGDISKYLVQRLKSNGPTENTSTKKQMSPNSNPNPFNITKREREILELVAKGLSNQEIADHLGKSKRTVEVHRFNLMKKMNVKNITELINMATSHGYLN